MVFHVRCFEDNYAIIYRLLNGSYLYLTRKISRPLNFSYFSLLRVLRISSKLKCDRQSNRHSKRPSKTHMGNRNP